MTQRLVPQQEASKWLAIAGRDLRMAEAALDCSPAPPAEGLYHAQQAAENALKGFLVFRGENYPLTHDIGLLPDLCGKIDASLEATVAPAEGLTQFATRFRYPGEEEQPVREEALPWIALARVVPDECSKRVIG